MDGLVQEKILATAQASLSRRWMGIGMFVVLGALLIALAFATPSSSALGLQVFLILCGAVAIAFAVKMHAATRLGLRLTETALCDSDGTEIARIEDIVRVNRGTFAFKPSHGFMLQLAQPRGRRWQPGIWWRMGRRVGIGGVLPGGQTKAIAEVLQVMISERPTG
ncbi:hypothetical protein TG4357_01943 [Thalassovita gelatinovora]|uniref:Uncharacterized protein n=1 Tax=Thalassovita gelatinovora TaxID=53501 RepID=A0A0P1FCJ3_THAGE|nr:hypothetical protein [Thalassovita gelatinovora]QIZ80119.1 hypothetical protein HFZ77_06340 [Thalassovita gelatinovora]CUH65572.1 hypothetical protein TG4357_01943 [Thalassovita gelatinovora]SER07383.1 hypothetical protein SAMN04488043_1157 [Thalassovita gelatinovora]